MALLNIDGLTRGEVLSALYNASQPSDMGILNATKMGHMTVEDAEEILVKKNGYVDYVYGKPFKIELHPMSKGFEAELFDRDSDIPAQKIIDAFRAWKRTLSFVGEER